MDETQVFTIPAGLSIESRGEGFTVDYEGDIVLHDALDGRIREVRSSAGDVRIHADLILDQIDAPSGTVRCFGSLKVGMIHADRIEIHGDIEASNLVAKDTIDLDGDCTVGDVRAQSVVLMGARSRVRVVQAGHRITVGSARLESDILVAPTVELASETGGKVKIIDCYNELGSNAVKGGLSIEDLDELLGDADGFLQQRGVTRLPGPPEGTADPASGSWEEPVQPRTVASAPSGSAPAHPSGIRDQGIVGRLIEWEKEERENAPTVPFKPGEHGGES